MKPVKLVMSAFGPYALYGQASGGKDRREGKSFRSDYASLTDETFVEYIFEHRGNTYRIVRNPDYERAKQRGEGTTKKSASATFECLDTDEILTGNEKVDRRIRELIGLDHKQFTQTVMIAQGDFLKILNAGSDERKKLFQKIFNTADFEMIQSKVKERNDICRQQLAEIKQNIANEMARICIDSDFLKADELSEYMTDGEYLPRALPVIAELAEFEKDKYEKALGAKQTADKELRACEAGYIKAETDNNDLARLDSLKREQAVLLEGEAEIGAKKKQLEKAAKAAEMEPAEAVMVRKEQEILVTKERLEKTIAKYELLNGRIPSLKEALDKAEHEFEAVEGMTKRIGEITESIDILNDYVNKKRTTEDLEKDMTKAFEESRKADETYASAKESYYMSQSGQIAQLLEDGTACPVCGSVEHPAPAKLQEGAATREDMEKAESYSKKMADKLSKYDKMVGEARAVLQAREERLGQLGIDKNSEISLLKAEKKELEARKTAVTKAKTDTETTYNDAMMDIKKTAGSIEELRASVTAAEADVIVLRDDFISGITEKGFASREAYNDAKLSAKEQALLDKQIRDYSEKRAVLKDQINEYTEKTSGKEYVDLTVLAERKRQLKAELANAESAERQAERNLQENAKALGKLEKLSAGLEKQRERAAVIGDLYDVIAAKRIGAQGKLTFEAYVQQYYFKEVVAAANKRLTVLTGGEFRLRCKEGVKDNRSQAGLDLDVLDMNTGQWRDVSTLSGGESFMASLALALGLSDIVQNRSGQVRLESMFIDEGFGSLDENALNQAMNLLAKLADGNRLIGVISHVAELKQRIDNKIIVNKKLYGSEIEIIK